MGLAIDLREASLRLYAAISNREYYERYQRGKKGSQLSAGPVLASHVADRVWPKIIHCD